MRMRLLLGTEVGLAELFSSPAPKTVQAVWAALPIEGTVNHAMFSGEEITFPTYGLLWERENQRYDTRPGDLGYFVEGPAICIYYGSLRVISPGNIFGRITENLEGIQRVSRASWKESGIQIRLRGIWPRSGARGPPIRALTARAVGPDTEP